MPNTFKKYLAKATVIVTLATIISPLLPTRVLTAYACDSVEACQTQLEQLPKKKIYCVCV